MSKKLPKPDLTYIHESLRPLAIPLALMTLDPRNHNQHSETSISRLAGSLRTYGQLKPIVVQRQADDIVIRSGNGTYQAAQSLGWTHLAAVVAEVNDATATGWAITDNQSAKYSTIDQAVLAELLKEVEFTDPELLLMEADIQAVLDGLEEPQTADAGPSTDAESGDTADGEYGVSVTLATERERTTLLATLREQGYIAKKFTP